MRARVGGEIGERKRRRWKSRLTGGEEAGAEKEVLKLIWEAAFRTPSLPTL